MFKLVREHNKISRNWELNFHIEALVSLKLIVQGYLTLDKNI